MPRRLFAVCLLVCLLLTGCRRQPAVEPLGLDFTCDFRAQYNDLAAAGTLTRHTAGTLKLDFSEPETLKGLSAEWDGESVTLHYLGLTYSVDPKKLPESALGEQLIAAFDAALRGEGTSEESNGKVTVTGSVSGAAYTFIYDKQSGAPLSLAVPSIPLSVTFSNVKTN